MIEFTKAYKVGERTFATLEEAQSCEIRAIISKDLAPDGEKGDLLFDSIVENIIANADKVIDILSTTANSKPRARRINGGTKKRKAKATGDGALADML